MGKISHYLRLTIITLIKAYQLLLSPIIGQHCRFYPSCSHYSLETFNRFGILTGLSLTMKRLLRCHPWHAGGVDFPPTSISLAKTKNAKVISNNTSQEGCN
jgi:hypothetical protein